MELKDSEVVLNKFKEIFQQCQTKKVTFNDDKSQKSQSQFSQQSQLSFISKFDQLTFNEFTKYKDLINLIKDNYHYFKHFFQLCVCSTCECGTCRCSYVKKEQKFVCFRGVQIKLQNHQQENPQLQIFNRNLEKNLFFIDQDSKEFNKTDKITQTVYKNKNNDFQKPLKQRYRIPLFYSESSQSYFNKQGISEQLTVKPQDNLPHINNKGYQPIQQMIKLGLFDDQKRSDYQQSYINQKYSKQKDLKIQDQIKFNFLDVFYFKKDQQKSEYQQNFNTKKKFQNQFYDSENNASLRKLQDINLMTTTHRNSYRKLNDNVCKENELQIKDQLLQILEFISKNQIQ